MKKAKVSNADKSVKDIQNAVLESIRVADRAKANTLLDAWAQEHGYENLFTKVLEPVLIHIGEEWHANESFTLAHAYVAAKVTEDMLQKIGAKSQEAARLIKGPVIIGNIEEDFHSLGRKMLGTFLQARGWIVYDLGNDVPPVEFIEKALEVKARVIGVSAMIMTTARNIRKLRQEIDRRGLAGKIQLAVGGAVFNVCPGLVEEVGGDGTAPNALLAPDLFDHMWEKSIEMESNL